MGVEKHRQGAAAIAGVGFAILTTSDSRTLETDATGHWAKEWLAGEGHRLVDHRLAANDAAAIAAHVKVLLDGPAELVLVTGGTGISARDVTLAAVTPFLERTLPGFGELFRALSHAEIGPAAMISGAILGVARGKLVACLPGSPGAVALALTRLIGPELRHLVSELRKG